MPVYQEVVILFSLTRCMETVLIRKCDIPILRTNLQLLMEIQLLSMTYAFWMVKDKIDENKEKFQ